MAVRWQPPQHGFEYWFYQPFLKREPYTVNLVSQQSPAGERYEACHYCGATPHHIIVRNEGSHIPVCTACIGGC